MKINPDDPVSKMTIRLDLAKAALPKLITESRDEGRGLDWLAQEALNCADAVIDRANREEGKVD